ncbi:hypothetical protein GQ44DRAFT_743162 [Phaeosphaeriaceae sp. PMI808]|nr:hypothetical protein GQ44DRAFT_743162 [Phaeosphaeriaceae sp. PMI808]
MNTPRRSVCALPVELAAAQEMLNEEHETLRTNAHNMNIYTCRRVGEYNIVIAYLPKGQTGTNSATAVTVQMKSAFTSTQFSLIVGIRGGAPSEEADVRLRDVVVSRPYKAHGRVVQYDSRKATPSGFERIGSLNTLPTILLNAVTNLQAKHIRGRYKLLEYFSKLDSLPEFRREATSSDALFEANYNHEGGATYSKQEVVVHYGTITSRNQVIRDTIKRDKISAKLSSVLYFKIEAASLINSFPYLVIRGIYDYTNSHKNKRTAAACAKEVLSVILLIDIVNSRTVEEAIREISS